MLRDALGIYVRRVKRCDRQQVPAVTLRLVWFLRICWAPLACASWLGSRCGLLSRSSWAPGFQGLRHLGAPTTQNPAFREASPENSAPQFTGARHTTNASFAAEVEARFRCEARDYGRVSKRGRIPVLDVERTTLAAFRNGAFDPTRTLRDTRTRSRSRLIR